MNNSSRIRQLFHHRRCPGLAASIAATAVAILLPLTAPAEVQKIDLPGKYSDFELNPRTGDLVALDVESEKAVLFRQADLKAGAEIEAAAEVRVGPTPVSVFYKEFGDTKVYAVVSANDANLYLIKASDFTLLKKISLDESGAHLVTGSRNPADPFIYYNYGSGHDSVAGVVSLRDLANKGVAFEDAADCAIGPFGRIAYRRGPWSPSGFESLIRTNALEAQKPAFTRLFYDHDSKGGYVPDPHGEFTAVGVDIYTASLMKKVGSVEFLPLAFFESEPVLVGRGGVDRRGRLDDKSGVILRAASYNTFSGFGPPIKLDYKAERDDDRRRGRLSPFAGQRLFADDGRKRVVFAAGRNAYLVPLADFEPPGEPVLLADLKGMEDLTLGEEGKLEVVPRGAGVEVVMEDQPDGAKVDDATITWTPNEVGKYRFAATLKHKTLERLQTFEVVVSYPSLSLPFAPAGITAIDAKRAFIWEGGRLDRWGRVEEGTEVATPRIAVIDLETGAATAERRLTSPVTGAVRTGDHVVVFGAQQELCYALQLGDLERKATLAASGPITKVESFGNSLLVSAGSTAEVFSGETFKKVRSAPLTRTGSSPSVVVTDYGLLLGNVLYGPDLEPRLISKPAQMLTLPGATGNPPAFLPKSANDAVQPTPRDGTLVESLRARNSSAELKLSVKSERRNVEGATHTWRTHREIVLTAMGSGEPVRQVLFKGEAPPSDPNEREPRPLPWAALGNTALVVDASRLFVWKWTEGALPEQATEPGWAYRQSETVLGATGTTVLEHEFSGRDATTTVSLLSPTKGATLDPESFNLTLDNKVLTQQAADLVKERVVRDARGGSFSDSLNRLLPLFTKDARQVLGRAPKGVPVLVPIRLTATSDSFLPQVLEYFVVAEVPNALLNEQLVAIDQDPPTSSPVVTPRPATPAGQSAAPSLNMVPVLERLAAIETRLAAMETQREEVDRRLAAIEGRSMLSLVLVPIALLIAILALVMRFVGGKGGGATA